MVSIVYGGDSYLNDQRVRDLTHQALNAYPDADVVELDATDADRYAFDEAVSPSLLADRAIVVVRNLQNADEKLGDVIAAYCGQSNNDANASPVICQHEGGTKGKRIHDLIIKAGAREEKVPDLKKADAKINFVMQQFERRHRRVDPMAAQQLVAVLGERTGELAAMCGQLCFDFDDDPIGIERVNQYLTADPQVSGFAVADRALEGAHRRRHRGHAIHHRTGHGTHRPDRRAGHETAHPGQGLGGQIRCHLPSGGQNQPVRPENRHATTVRMDIRRARPMHPNPRMGGRTEQNQRGRPGLRLGTRHHPHRQQRTRTLT